MMEGRAGRIKSRKKLIIAIVVIAVVVAIGMYGFVALQSMARMVNTVAPATIILAKTDLESKVTASGNFMSIEPVTVGSNTQYAEVKDVFVEVGSYVYEGDLLAQLKTSDIERNIADAKDGISEMRKGDAQKLEAAQRAFNDADSQYYAEERQTQRAVDNAKKDLNEAITARDDIITGNAGVVPVPTDLVYPDYLKAEEAIKLAQKALESAEQLKENTMRMANSQWYSAKANLDALQGVDSAKSQLSQLDSLSESLENASIISPITGVVTSVNTEAGMAAMGSMFVIENTDSLEISALVAEYDIIKIEEGMHAYITSNATDAHVYEGMVTFVAPVASDMSGSFQVRVKVTSSIGQLKPGMTATVEIVVESKKEVFAVPIDSVVTLPDGKKAVYVYEPAGIPLANGGLPGGIVEATGDGDGGPPADGEGIGSGPVSRFGPGAGAGGPPADGADRREIVVTTGMETDYYIEIISGELTEGMLIIADPLGRSIRGSGPGGGMMMMGGETVYVESAGPGQTVTVMN